MTINLTDPANHPANSPLAAERIERVIEALESSLKYRNGSTLDHFIADAVKGLRELREVRKSSKTPAAIVHHDEKGFHALLCRELPEGTPLYVAPAAPDFREISKNRYVYHYCAVNGNVSISGIAQLTFRIKSQDDVERLKELISGDDFRPKAINSLSYLGREFDD